MTYWLRTHAPYRVSEYNVESKRNVQNCYHLQVCLFIFCHSLNWQNILAQRESKWARGVCACVCLCVCGHFWALVPTERVGRLSWNLAHELKCYFATNCLKYYGIRRFCDVTVAFFNSLRRHRGGLNFYRIFSKLLSEVLKCQGMSGIAFESDPLIISPFPVWRHMAAILDFRQN